jgi:hypothetical protein
MKVHLNVNNKGVVTQVFAEIVLSNEERFLLHNLLETGEIYKEISEKIKDVNSLGEEMYKGMKQYGYIRFFEGGFGIDVDKDSVSKKALNEVTFVIGKVFAEKLVQAIDIPEVNEVILKARLPQNVVDYLKKRGVNLTYKCTVVASKKIGFNDIELKTDVNVSSQQTQIFEVLNELRNKKSRFFEGLKVTYDDAEIVLLPVGYRPISYIRPKGDISKLIDEIKKSFSEQVKKIIDNNYFAAFAIATYNPLDYEREIRVGILNNLGFETVYVHIYRKWLLDPLYVDISFEPPSFMKCNDLELEIDGEDKKYVLNLQCGPVEYSVYQNLTDDNTIKEREERIINGDFSVIDEVENIDELITDRIVEQVKEGIRKLIEENTDYSIIKRRNRVNKSRKSKTVKKEIDIDATVNVFDLMDNEGKEKVISYLVAQKLKSSEEEGE